MADNRPSTPRFIRKPWYQQLIQSYLLWLLLAFLSAGALLDVLLNTLQVITPPVTYAGTLLVLVIFGGFWLLVRLRGVPWVAEDGQNTARIRNIGPKPVISAVAILVLLWMPRFVSNTLLGGSTTATPSLTPTNTITSVTEASTVLPTGTAVVGSATVGVCGGESTDLPVPAGPLYFNERYGFTLYNAESTAEAGTNGPIDNVVRSLYVDEDGLWVGSAGQSDDTSVLVYVSGILDQASITPSHRRYEICSDHGQPMGTIVNAILRSEDGSLWVATDGSGVWRLIAGSWIQYLRDQTTDTLAMPGSLTYALLASDETVYVGTREGLHLFNGITWSHRSEGVRSELIHSLALDTNGGFWIGYASAALDYIGPDGSVQRYTTANGLTSDNVRSLVIDNDGRLWVATWGGGLNVLDQGNWTSHLASDAGLPSNNVMQVAMDPLGRIWAATDAGTAFLDGTQWRLYHNLPTLALAFGRSGKPNCPEAVELWTGTDGSGLTNGRLPPSADGFVIEDVQGVPEVVKPGEVFTPVVTVRLAGGMVLSEGDFLLSPDDRNLAGHPLLPVPPGVTADAGAIYVFDFSANPLTAPREPGHYQSAWRLWQCTRFVDPLIEFQITVQE